MHILLTNDDGIDAPGLAALRRSLDPFLDQGLHYSVVAPDRERSECGHAVTTRRALNSTRRGEREWAVDGTPVDCVRLALSGLVPKVQLILSGVNDGGNLGVDLLVSGTFAAAKEGFLRGLPAVAVSHYRHPQMPRSWEHVPRWLACPLTRVLQQAQANAPRFLININLPAIDPEASPEWAECQIDHSPFDVQYEPLSTDAFQLRTSYQNRPRIAGGDVAVCFGGKIAITHLESL